MEYVLTRSLLLQHAEAGCFQALWSPDILVELSRNLQLKANCSSEQVQHLLEEMKTAFPEAMVSYDTTLIEALIGHLPDQGDAHVIAAAIQGRADLVVTCNLKHFPQKILEPYFLEAVHPDDFLVTLLDQNESLSFTAVWECFEGLKRSRPSWSDYLKRLQKIELKSFAGRLRRLKP